MLLWLTLAAIVQTPQTGLHPHAGLHPRDADLYVEVPDVAAAFAAYRHAPLVQMVSSEGAVRIAAFAKELGFDLAATLQSLLPVADPTRADDRWWPWSAARRASFSLTGLERQSASVSEFAGWGILDFADAEAAEQARLALIAMGGPETPAAEAPARAAATTRLRIPLLDAEGWVARDDARLVLGAGAARHEELGRRGSSPEAGLPADWRGFGVLEPARGTVLLDGLSNLETTPSILDEEGPIGAVVALLAPYLFGKGRWRIELDADRFVTVANYEPRGPAAELYAAFGASPLGTTPKGETASYVPPDAVGAWIANVDASKLEQALAVLFASTLGTSVVAPPADGEPRMADGLGSAMAASFLPLQSLMQPTPRILLVLELTDAARFQAGLDAWLERARVAQPELSVERRPHRKTPLFVVGGKAESEAPSAGGASPLAGVSVEPRNVSIAVLPDRVLFATTVTTARGEIKRVQELAESRTSSTHEALKRVVKPADAIEASTMDWGELLGKLYEGLRGLAPMLAQNRAEPLDLAQLPTGAQLFAPFRGSASVARRVEGRILLRSESSFGPETPAALAGIAFLVQRPGGPPPAPPVEPAPPKPVEAAPVEEDPRAVTLVALRELRTAIAVYRSQHGRAPSSPADLLVGNEAFPDGFVKGGRIPLDAWGRSLVYASSPDGSSYSLHSTGADGIDQQGGGDDIRLP
ncbi:MAG: type II secretion system protein GspG [Planctomycetes bacterium]|nr:type II secretion system protein GspG [Planctomycetota bacterium]